MRKKKVLTSTAFRHLLQKDLYHKEILSRRFAKYSKVQHRCLRFGNCLRAEDMAFCFALAASNLYKTQDLLSFLFKVPITLAAPLHLNILRPLKSTTDGSAHLTQPCRLTRYLKKIEAVFTNLWAMWTEKCAMHCCSSPLHWAEYTQL